MASGLPCAGSLLGSGLSVVRITTPELRQGFQRQSGYATVPISGTYTGFPTAIQYKFTPLNGGTLIDWTNASYSMGTFSASPSVAQGWYRLDVKSSSPSGGVVIATVAKLGVGDIFITGGQSVSANFAGMGEPLNTVSDDRINATDLSLFPGYQLANDPQPSTAPNSGSMSSIWSFFASSLITTTNVPIFMINTAIGNTMLSQWLPGANPDYYQQFLMNAVQLFGANGFCAFLWGQGENDAVYSTPQATYFSEMQTIIGQLRTDAGWNIPLIMCDTETYEMGAVGQAPVQAAQMQVVSSVSNTFAGADTDSVGAGPTLRYDGTHPTLLGASDMGTLWANAVIASGLV